MVLLILVLFSFQCQGNVNTIEQDFEGKLEGVFPFEIELGGVIREIEDVQLSIPTIKLLIKSDSIEITVGQTEKYFSLLDSTEFVKLLPYLSEDYFKDDRHFYNPYMPYGGLIRLNKEIQGKKYTKTVTNFKRRDIEIEYIDMDSIEIFKSYHLSRIANEIAIPFIKDDIDKENMVIAKSMKQALQTPEKVYELTLRNTRTKYLSPNIRKLKNLRILDISGSFITEIPAEIEECKNLKIIKANASQLSLIPSTIGNLKKLRVLNFGYCKIKSIPSEIGNIETLWSLGLGSNQLSELPESLSNLKNMTFFSIAHNKFKVFPNAVLGMDSVGNLWIHGNQIKEIPIEISEMKSLHHFLVSESEIQNLNEIKKVIPSVRIIDEK